MAFREVFDHWREAGRDEDCLNASVVVALLASTWEGNQVWQNLDADPTMSDEQREQLLEFLLLKEDGTPQHVLKRLCQFCHQPANQLTGAQDPVAQAATLGHVKSRSAWQSYFEGSFGSSARGFATRRRRSAATTIDDLLGRTVDEQRQLLAGRSLSRYNMWSFYQPHQPDAPFTDVTCTYIELKRRLGLGAMSDPNGEAIYWAHRLQASQAAHHATALDAADYHYYRPGGRTNPLDGTNDGLPEIIHVPVTGDQLVQPIAST